MVNQEKRWDWKHMLNYEMRIGQCEIAPNDWNEKDAQKGKRLNWKRCPERKNIEIKKMPKWEKIVLRKMKNGLPIINLPI